MLWDPLTRYHNWTVSAFGHAVGIDIEEWTKSMIVSVYTTVGFKQLRSGQVQLHLQAVSGSPLGASSSPHLLLSQRRRGD